MNWDTDYREYSANKTPEAFDKWHLAKAKASSSYLCSGLPSAYDTFLHSTLSLDPMITPDYEGYIKPFIVYWNDMLLAGYEGLPS